MIKKGYRTLFLVAGWWPVLMLPAAPETGRVPTQWTSPKNFRVLLAVDARGRRRSQSPAALSIDFQKHLLMQGASGVFDEHSIEVIPLDPAPVNPARHQKSASARSPYYLERFFGSTEVTLHFVIRHQAETNFAVYFDTIESGLGKPKRFSGLAGDGVRFRQGWERREIAATHFDAFSDLDGDGDLDLFKGGVEPYVYCYENIGRNRWVERGRLASGGKLFKLPASRANRSWVTVAFFDIDGDGQQDFIPSFGDGPDAGQIILYRNSTREHQGQLTFTRVGPLQTSSGSLLAGGAQAGGWFPSITLLSDFDGDGQGPDALVGSNHRCWFYRGIGTNAEGAPRFGEGIAIQAGGKDIVLTNPRFDCADVDADGDLDLFASTQPGPVYWFKNTGARTKPEFAPAILVGWSGQYLIGDAHSGVKVADFDHDGLLDLVSGRFWERTDLKAPEALRDFGGFFKNVGTPLSPRFQRQTRGGPFTEEFQPCDAIRQNCVRAVDWDEDGRLDLLAGDTDGFVWHFHNQGNQSFPLFTAGERIYADGRPLTVARTGGHARLDVSDWNSDGRQDILVADGSGTVTLFLNHGRKSKPALGSGQKVLADGQAIQLAGRASVLVCDWDNDGRKDLLLADEKGYYFVKNLAAGASPILAPPKLLTFGGRRVSYVRPNLGSFVDWDGDGKRDLIGCHFENSVRFYRNIGSGAPGTEPQFADPEGVIILQAESPQMISGADVVDWNGDGDLDLLTGQGHGGSGLRFFERDWIEDEIRGTHPRVAIVAVETKPKR